MHFTQDVGAWMKETDMRQRSQLWSHVTAVWAVRATGDTKGEHTASQRRKGGQRTVVRQQVGQGLTWAGEANWSDQ